MDKTYQKLLRLGIDLAPLGVERREDNAPYFCTPKGASVIGWAGVDGIHFCFIRGFGGRVFAVSPANSAPNFVHPLARDFADFLRLLLACGDVAALEQAWMWDEEEFAAFLREIPPTPEQQQTLSEIKAAFSLEPMEHPWAYIKELQSAFDYGKIRYSEEYYDSDMNPSAVSGPAEWKVYFDGGFSQNHGRARAGKEIQLGKDFLWASHRWTVPAAYSCAKGLILDICMRAEAEDIKKFKEKWAPFSENFTREQEILMEAENPLTLNFTPRITLNGKTLRAANVYGVFFDPCVSSDAAPDADAALAVEHYGLDTAAGWVISRCTFPWGGRREIKSLSLSMEHNPDLVPGPLFKAHAAGDTFEFSHPVSGEKYTLTVRELERQTIPEPPAEASGSRRFFFPTHMTVMRYTLSPATDDFISVRDCDEGDNPLDIMSSGNADTASFGIIGIIGGADGPTSVLLGEKKEAGVRLVHSSLHFEPQEDDVEWQTEFRGRKFDGGTFQLI